MCITITAIPAITIQILGEFRLDLGIHTLSRILRVIVALKAIQVTDLHMGLVIVAKVIQISGLDMVAVIPLLMEVGADLLWEVFSQDLDGKSHIRSSLGLAKGIFCKLEG